MTNIEYLIIGAGPTGIGAACRLVELEKSQWIICDREKHPGGLASSVTDNQGFTWDLGGHVQFSHYKSFDRYMNLAIGQEGWWHHERESSVRIAGQFVPYPLQNNLHRLPPELRWKCIEGLLKAVNENHGAPTNGKPRHFEEWNIKTFGQGIAELFLFPYNFKVWAYPLSAMGFRWVGERVSVPPLDRVLKHLCLEKDDVSWGPNRTFGFPKYGGTGAIWRSLTRQLPQDKVRLGNAVTKIDPRRHRAWLQDGTQLEYECCISTIPVDLLTRVLEIPSLREAASNLFHSSVHVIGVGLKGQAPTDLRTKCWMYFPESNCPFYRVTVFSNYSPYNVPEPMHQWSLMAEVSESRYKPVDSSRVVADTVQGMLATQLVPRHTDILCTWHQRLEYGYPTPSLQRDDAISVLLPALENFNIFSRGRFGAWKYEVSNQDHSFAQGREIVDRLTGIAESEKGPEPTLNHPEWVNNRVNP